MRSRLGEPRGRIDPHYGLAPRRLRQSELRQNGDDPDDAVAAHRAEPVAVAETVGPGRPGSPMIAPIGNVRFLLDTGAPFQKIGVRREG